MGVISINTENKDTMAPDLANEIEKALNETVKERDDFKEDLEKDSVKMPPHELAEFVKKNFEEVDDARQETEKRWLTDLRQVRGQYDPETLEKFRPNRSRAYVRLTRNKVKTVDSRMVDFVRPANGSKNWSITPTPLPELSPMEIDKLLAMHQQQTGEDATPEQFKSMVQAVAQEKTKRMERVIEDQLAELKYRDIIKDVIHSGDLYGTGILKGPMVSVTTARQYKRSYTDEGEKTWTYSEHDELTPFAESVPIWDVYPDMSAVTLDDCRFVIQRHKMEKSKLLSLADRADFDQNIIYKYVADYPNGDYEDQYYESQLQAMGNRVTANSGQQSTGKKYQVLEYWGYIDAEDLESFGLEIPEKIKGKVDVACNLWVLGSYVIKATLAPLQGIRLPYFFYYYDKDETSIWGEGIASIMRDVQELINASFRAMLDNAAISAGPQIEANLDLLNEDEDPTEVYPFKVWLRTGEGADATASALRVTPLPSYTSEYIRLNELLEQYGDEITTIPRYMWGDQAGGAGRTASGLSMMMGSANITIKDQVKNFDDGITKPFISAMYHWNMQFNPDASIKGDYTVVAEGTSSLIAREVHAQSLMNFANITNNAVDMPMVRREKIIRAIAESLDLEDQDLVRSDMEIEAMRQQQAAQAEAERQFMNNMTELARENGVSPTDLIANMKDLYQTMQSTQQGQPGGMPGAPQPEA